MRPTSNAHHRTRGRRALVAAVTAGAAVLGLGAAPALGHTLTVQPPGGDDPVVDQAVSRPWAQAHCHAQSPATTHGTTDGTVTFTPQAVFEDCPAPNPGGQVHPHHG